MTLPVSGPDEEPVDSNLSPAFVYHLGQNSEDQDLEEEDGVEIPPRRGGIAADEGIDAGAVEMEPGTDIGAISELSHLLTWHSEEVRARKLHIQV